MVTLRFARLVSFGGNTGEGRLASEFYGSVTQMEKKREKVVTTCT